MDLPLCVARGNLAAKTYGGYKCKFIKFDKCNKNWYKGFLEGFWVWPVLQNFTEMGVLCQNNSFKIKAQNWINLNSFKNSIFLQIFTTLVEVASKVLAQFCDNTAEEGKLAKISQSHSGVAKSEIHCPWALLCVPEKKKKKKKQALMNGVPSRRLLHNLNATALSCHLPKLWVHLIR